MRAKAKREAHWIEAVCILRQGINHVKCVSKMNDIPANQQYLSGPISSHAFNGQVRYIRWPIW